MRLARCGECPEGARPRVGLYFKGDPDGAAFIRYVRGKKGTYGGRLRMGHLEVIPPSGLEVTCRRDHRLLVTVEQVFSAANNFGPVYLRSATTSGSEALAAT